MTNLVIFLLVLLSIISNNKLLTLETCTKSNNLKIVEGLSILQWNESKCSIGSKKPSIFYTTLLKWNRNTSLNTNSPFHWYMNSDG